MNLIEPIIYVSDCNKTYRNMEQNIQQLGNSKENVWVDLLLQVALKLKPLASLWALEKIKDEK